MVEQNPLYPESKNIIKEIVTVPVHYIDREGNEHEGVIEMHKSVAQDVQIFFQAAYHLHFPIQEIAASSAYGWVDQKLTSANTTSGYNYRTIAGSTKLSLHSQGLAFDVNPRLNPYIRFDKDTAFIDPPGATYDPSLPGTLTPNHALVDLMKSMGWEWGGDWTPDTGRTDYQHFQKPPTSPSDALQ